MNITRKQIRQAFHNNGTDKLWLHGYDQMYFDVFSNIETLDSLVEIGVLKGKSLMAWMDLFPETKIYGLDTNLTRATNERLQAATLIECNSTDKKVREVISDPVDVIIDDGSHHVNDQWTTFYLLRDKFKKAYVIEDIIGKENEALLRARFKKHGFNNKIKTYSSLKQDAVYRIKGQDVVIAFYAMVIEPVM